MSTPSSPRLVSCQPTKVVEDSFNAMRAVESLEQRKKDVSSVRKWWVPVTREILGERHGYRE
eukprot:10598789-Lingulodinium_polyedra.AAC.1